MHTTGSFLLANSREAVFDTVRISRKKIANSLYNFKNHLIYTLPTHNMYLLKLSLNTFFVPTIQNYFDFHPCKKKKPFQPLQTVFVLLFVLKVFQNTLFFRSKHFFLLFKVKKKTVFCFFLFKTHFVRIKQKEKNARMKMKKTLNCKDEKSI